MHGTHVGDSIHGSTEAYIFLSIRGKFILNSTLKVMYLCEDTDIPEHFLNAGTYADIVVIGGSSKGRNKHYVNSSSRNNGLTLSWNNEALKFTESFLLILRSRTQLKWNVYQAERVCLTSILVNKTIFIFRS